MNGQHVPEQDDSASRRPFRLSGGGPSPLPDLFPWPRDVERAEAATEEHATSEDGSRADEDFLETGHITLDADPEQKSPPE